MQIFHASDMDLLNYTAQRSREMCQKIEVENETYLLNVNETQYIAHLVNQYRVEDLEIDFEAVHITSSEQMIPAERFPGFVFNVRRGQQYPKQVITYHLPYSGNLDLLKHQPSTYMDWKPDVKVERGNISFDVINFYDDPAKVKKEADDAIDVIRQQYEFVKRDVARFNDDLPRKAAEDLQQRKKKILQLNNFAASLGVPIKKAASVPETFAVPAVERKIIVRPSAPTSAYKPEPVLDDHTYQEILKVIDEFGKTMERHPSIYQNKKEEPLRDLFLMQLTPHFKSTAGEAFNKKGKTDILIQHENNNVFVAECKVWKGLEVYYGTIDQLLSYLTWRDTKTAILMFVQNKQITNVLQQVKDDTAKHPCFVKFKGNPSEARFDFEFHLPDDESRGVQLAVFCFHFV